MWGNLRKPIHTRLAPFVDRDITTLEAGNLFAHNDTKLFHYLYRCCLLGDKIFNKKSCSRTRLYPIINNQWYHACVSL